MLSRLYLWCKITITQYFQVNTQVLPFYYINGTQNVYWIAELSLLPFIAINQFRKINFIFLVCRLLKTTSKSIEVPGNQFGFQFKKFDSATARRYSTSFVPSTSSPVSSFQAVKLMMVIDITIIGQFALLGTSKAFITYLPSKQAA